MLQNKRSIWTFLLSGIIFLLLAGTAFAGEADIKLPDLTNIAFLGGALSGMTILNVGLAYLRHRNDFRFDAIRADKKSARPSSPCWTFPRPSGKPAKPIFSSRENSWSVCGY